jgi:hypothetical protein
MILSMKWDLFPSVAVTSWLCNSEVLCLLRGTDYILKYYLD